MIISGDTAPCRSTAEAARGAELLIHDASFTEEEAQRAAETGHSTVGQAAALAREAEVKLLALVHIRLATTSVRSWMRLERFTGRCWRHAISI